MTSSRRSRCAARPPSVRSPCIILCLSPTLLVCGLCLRLPFSFNRRKKANQSQCRTRSLRRHKRTFPTRNLLTEQGQRARRAVSARLQVRACACACMPAYACVCALAVLAHAHMCVRGGSCLKGPCCQTGGALSSQVPCCSGRLLPCVQFPPLLARVCLLVFSVRFLPSKIPGRAVYEQQQRSC